MSLYHKSNRIEDVKDHPWLKELREYSLDNIDKKYKEFHVSMCKYYDSGKMSLSQIDRWRVVVRVSQSLERKKLKRQDKRI